MSLSILTRNEMRESLDGMFWTPGRDFFFLPTIGDPVKAGRLFLSTLATFTWNSLSTLENNPASLPLTATILSAGSASMI